MEHQDEDGGISAVNNLPQGSRLSFSSQAQRHQCEWRRGQSGMTMRLGTQNKVEYEHILPRDEWMSGVWDRLRKPLVSYLDASMIQANEGKHNLKSSWTQCANVFFPFRVDANARRMLASFLTRQLGLQIASVDSIELEYAADGRLSPSQLLGEKNGMRGSGQTSPDVAILFTCDDGTCGIYLIENKYTEHHFYGCSAAKKTLDASHLKRGLEPNPSPGRCKDLKALVADYRSACHQVSWGRQYWTILRGTANERVLRELPSCPALADGYQLLRQQALAQGIAESHLFDHVYHGVACDSRNDRLISCLRRLGMTDFRTDWPTLFNSDVRFHCFAHQDLVDWVTRTHSRFIRDWREYVRNRYDYP